MSDLMTAIKNRLLDYQNSDLKAVKTYQRGVLPPIPQFPAIAVLPVRETLSAPRSGGVCRNDRELSIEIYEKGLKSSVNLRTAMDIADAIKDILKDKFRMEEKGTENTYDLYMDTQTIGEPQPFRNSMLQKITIPVVCRSLESLPSASSSTKIKDASQKDLLDEIFNRIDWYKFSKAIKTKKKATLPPCMGYPSIHVLEDTDIRDRTEAALDMPTREFTIAIFNKQLDKEVLLDDLITIVEDTKDCLQENSKFNNKCRNSWIPTIEYGSYTTDRGILYSAFVILQTWCWDPV